MNTTELLTQNYFSEIYEEHYADVYRFICFKLGNKEAAEDFAQDVFVKAWHARKSFAGRSSVKTWLISIASNHLKDMMKSGRCRTADVSHLETVKAECDVENLCIAKMELDRVEKIIHSLPDTYKEAFVLVRCSEMTYKEAADALGISVSLLKVRVHRAHLQLTKKLSGGDI